MKLIIKTVICLLPLSLFLSACMPEKQSSSVNEMINKVVLSHGIDESAGGDDSYIIKTINATYYLEKQGGGLSSMLDKDGVDWLGFHKKKGTGHKGEYRGFPNAIHKQDGNYFHAMNAGTDVSTSSVDIETTQHVRITFTSSNGQWQGQWDFYPERLDFTMSKVSPGYHYWIQYEGVPSGSMDESDFWFASVDNKKQPINEAFLGDLPAPEWIAFGDVNSSRMLYLLHHQDDEHPDNYVSRPDMTVFGFGRSNKGKYLDLPQSFSIGFAESSNYQEVKALIEYLYKSL